MNKLLVPKPKMKEDVKYQLIKMRCAKKLDVTPPETSDQ